MINIKYYYELLIINYDLCNAIPRLLVLRSLRQYTCPPLAAVRHVWYRPPASRLRCCLLALSHTTFHGRRRPLLPDLLGYGGRALRPALSSMPLVRACTSAVHVLPERFSPTALLFVSLLHAAVAPCDGFTWSASSTGERHQ